MNDEKLGAFLDRELSADERAEAARLMLDNPGAAARFFVFRRGDEVLRQALPLGEFPSQHALSQRILAAPPAMPVALPWARRFAAFAAAALIGVLVGQAGAPQRPGFSLHLDAPAQRALDAAPSGETRPTGAGDLTVAMTLRTPDGGFCRQFRVTSAAGGAEALACRVDGAWRVRAAADAADGQAGFHAAGGNGALALALSAAEGAVLVEADEETALIARRWVRENSAAGE